jgi:hypothetical protein
VATQGPGIDGTREERTTGRTGTYGWTLREGMQISATTGLPVGVTPAPIAPPATNAVVAAQ